MWLEGDGALQQVPALLHVEKAAFLGPLWNCAPRSTGRLSVLTLAFQGAARLAACDPMAMTRVTIDSPWRHGKPFGLSVAAH
jgi:hypothetical protein